MAESNHSVTSMRDFVQQAREAKLIRRAERAVALAILLILLAAVFGAVGYVMITTSIRSVDDPDRLEGFVIGMLVIGLAMFFVGGAVAGLIGRSKRWRRRRAAAQTALAHGWHYHLETPPSWYGGILFRAGIRGWVESSMHVHEPRHVEVANYVFQPEAGTTSGLKALEEVGFVRVPLERPMPHMYLMAQGRIAPRPYGFPFSGQQTLDLEGDFTRHFRLYVPKGYERDALYVFTPDLMATLIDEVGGSDVEIIDDHMFVYAARGFDLADPSVLDAATRIAATLGSRTQRRTARYVDDRSEHPAFIGADGARLKPVSRALIAVAPGVVTIAVLAVWGWASGVFG